MGVCTDVCQARSIGVDEARFRGVSGGGFGDIYRAIYTKQSLMKQSKMKYTLNDIARNTGYAKSTVSRVLSGKADSGRISRETTQAIRKEAERLGYVPNVVAKKIRAGKSHSIGLVVPSIANPYFADISSIIISEARKHGYSTIVTDTMEDASSQNTAIASLLAAKVAGIIIVPCGDDSSFLEQANDDYTPIVLMDRYYENSNLPYVVTNNYKGGYDATRALAKYGHKKIACIQGSPQTTPNKKRIEGYLRALNEAGLGEHARIVGNEFSVNNGYIETTLLLQDRESRPTAVFALSNTIGLGALKAIREAGLQIPQDISLISFDNNLYLDYLTPAISRIGQMVDEMGRMAFKILLESISGSRKFSSQIELAPEIILRDSIAPPAKD